MKKIPILLLFIPVLLLSLSCQTQKKEESTEIQEEPPKKSRPLAIEHGKFMEEGGKKLLYGGEDSTWHFDISNSILKDEQYHYGIGREKFKALLKPEFMNREEADEIYPDSARFLVLTINDESRAYGIDLLTKHEVVNDVVGGEPVMAAYCILADLGAIYDRTYGDTELTFGVSGYTYFDPEVWDGMDGFILWDRETESTWWPLIGKAVSGDLLETELNVYDESNWDQTTWGDIKARFEEIRVLRPDQTMDPPLDWPRLTDEQIAEVKGFDPEKAVAPRWGEN